MISTFTAMLKALLIIVFVWLPIFIIGRFCYTYVVYRRIRKLYGETRDWYKTTVNRNVYNKFIHVSFESMVKFYNVSPDKYEVECSEIYGGFYYLTRTDEPNLSENLRYPCVREVYYFIMDAFSDFLKYQKFCKSIDKQRQQEERRKEEQQDLQQSDSALADYVELVKGDIAKNERQLNEKIEQLKEELQKQKDMLKEK